MSRTGMVLSILLGASLEAAVPLSFEPNRGQFDSAVEYLARTGTNRIAVRRAEMIVLAESAPLTLRFAGAATASPFKPLAPLPAS